MSNIQVTLPDGSVTVRRGGHQAHRYRAEASARVWPTPPSSPRSTATSTTSTRPLEDDATLQILTAKDPDALDVYRHSTAHLLAAAVLELFPETKLGIGPPIETGFYYDFDRAEPFTPEDLEKIEEKMWELQAQDLPYERMLIAKDEGLRKYRR